MKRLIKVVPLCSLFFLTVVYLAEFFVGRYLIAHSGMFPAEMFVADEMRGLALSPGFNKIVQRVRAFHVSINPQGYRDRDWQQTNARRVLLVGSSATFGFGLDQEAGIAAQLEKEFGPGVSVLNSAVYSYGPPQALSTIKLECTKWQPQLIVYLHEYKMTRRDFLSNRGLVEHVQSADEAKTSRDLFGWRLPALRMYLSNRGFHPTQIWERVRGLDRLSEAYLKSRYAITESWGKTCSDCASRVATLIQQMFQAARQCGARFVVAVLPGPGEAYYGFKEPATNNLLNNLRTIGPAIPVADLRSGIPLGTNFSLPATDYFNPEGNRFIATELAQYLSTMLPSLSKPSPKDVRDSH